jgi:phosphatidylglycerophosphatase A
MKQPVWASLRPGWSLPPLKENSCANRLAVVLGTGFGSGGFRPFSASWGSIPGFAYGFALLSLSSPIAYAACTLAVIVLSVPICGKCAQLFNDDDPKSVVLDEIACVPLAIWPAWGHALTCWQWVLAFVVYRLADGLKPFPARRAEDLPGGWGIMLDDVISSFYMGVVWFLGQQFLARH